MTKKTKTKSSSEMTRTTSTPASRTSSKNSGKPTLSTTKSAINSTTKSAINSTAIQGDIIPPPVTPLDEQGKEPPIRDGTTGTPQGPMLSQIRLRDKQIEGRRIKKTDRSFPSLWYLYIFWSDDTSSHYPNYDDISKAIRTEEQAIELAKILMRDYSVVRVHVYEHKPIYRFVVTDNAARSGRYQEGSPESFGEDNGDEYEEDNGD